MLGSSSNWQKKKGHRRFVEKWSVTRPTIFHIKETPRSLGIPLHTDRQVHFGTEIGISPTAATTSVNSGSWHHSLAGRKNVTQIQHAIKDRRHLSSFTNFLNHAPWCMNRM
jgi:hypothetical protein